MTDTAPEGSVDTINSLTSLLSTEQDAERLASALKVIADRSREDLDIRQQLAQHDVLKGLVSRLQTSASSQEDVELQQQLLRCIGNACALNPDAIRTLCSMGLQCLQPYYSQDPAALAQMLRDSVGGITYNLLAADFSADGDSEVENPATKACFGIGVHDWIVALITGRTGTRLSIEELVDMLFWLSSCASNNTIISDLSISRILTDICPASVSWSAEAVSTWIEAVVSLLRSQATKAIVAARHDIGPLYELLSAVEDRIAFCKASSDAESEDLSVLVPQSSNLTWLLSDISAEATFAKDGRTNKSLLSTCIDNLHKPAQSDQLFIAAALILGNALLNLEASEATTLIRQGVAGSVVSRLSREGASSDLLYAGAGLLSNMCRPKDSRDELGATPGLLELIERLCRSDTPQLSQAGLRLVRSLGRDCPANQSRMAAILQALPKPAEQPAAIA